MGYFFMLPELCEAYRRLQSGKRHASFTPDEILDLLVEFPNAEARASLENHLRQARNDILQVRRQALHIRENINRAFRNGV